MGRDSNSGYWRLEDFMNVVCISKRCCACRVLKGSVSSFAVSSNLFFGIAEHEVTQYPLILH